MGNNPPTPVGSQGARVTTPSVADQASPDDAAPPPSAGGASASLIREALHLTPHQLGEYTRRLDLDVGNRPNYPRYGAAEVHLLVAVQALRDLQVPVDDACLAIRALRTLVTDGDGWVVLYPTTPQWVAVPAVSVEALVSLLNLTARAVVVDLESLRVRGRASWLDLAPAPM